MPAKIAAIHTDAGFFVIMRLPDPNSTRVRVQLVSSLPAMYVAE